MNLRTGAAVVPYDDLRHRSDSQSRPAGHVVRAWSAAKQLRERNVGCRSLAARRSNKTHDLIGKIHLCRKSAVRPFLAAMLPVEAPRSMTPQLGRDPHDRYR